MRHAKKKHKLNRFTSWRKLTLRAMLRNLLVYEQIKTTLAKAKATKPLAERLISLAQQDTLHHRRMAYDILGDHKLVKLLFDDIAKRFLEQKGGFARIMRLGWRRGDGAQLAILELTKIKKKETRKKQAKEKEKKTAPAQEQTEEKVASPLQQTKPAQKGFLGGVRKIFKRERDSL